nr:collagen alpha-4(VI) chain-like [Columba livia]XP_021154355.1 collagen alpha-4(VI) chain-like [Columba livia]XP_021154356.1 collagen alpha-4(VI) chain-like [Columba livia]XP_021154357.1 collagen alpha-4(VI) chain-like [Columba livia]
MHIHAKAVQHGQQLCQALGSPRMGRDMLSVGRGPATKGGEVFKMDDWKPLLVLLFFSTFCSVDAQQTDCDIDLSIAIDISRHMQPASTVLLKQKLQAFLPKLLLQMKLLPNTSCNAGSLVNIRFKFQVLAQTKEFIFDSDFEDYNEEIIQRFLGAQTTVNTYLNADFLQALEEKFFNVTSAKVKVT